ncbi:MAG: isocitrate/isopropylmalate dehydrogenase family protein [Burkholderiales bacterium]
MSGHRVTLIPGDGIGPEVIEAARRVLEATGVAFDWNVQMVGAPALEKFGTPLPDSVVASVVEHGVALKGPVSTPVGKGFPSVNVALRKASGLYANLRPCRSFDGVPSPFRNVDVVVVRDVTEDCYQGLELAAESLEANELIAKLGALIPGAAIAAGSGITVKTISFEASRRVVELAADHARKSGRTHVTAVHKAGVMKRTDGIFLEAAREVAARHPDIEFDDMNVDAACAALVRHPESFQVLVMPMQYGDILSDLAGGLVGGPGMVPGVAVGTKAALFEPGHGSAPRHAGKDCVNPTATMLSGAMMLRHLGETAAADRLEWAIAAVIAEGRAVTYDMILGRNGAHAVGTAAMADAVIAHLNSGESQYASRLPAP